MDYDGAGVINRIWMTIIERSPASLRSIYIEIYWDGANKPAVAVPLGDFFGIGLGRRTAFQKRAVLRPGGQIIQLLRPHAL